MEKNIKIARDRSESLKELKDEVMKLQVCKTKLLLNHSFFFRVRTIEYMQQQLNVLCPRITDFDDSHLFL